jgi:hypothetical protein
VALILDPTGAATAVAKLAADDRGIQALAKERHALSTMSDIVPHPLRAPTVLDADDGLLLLEAIQWRPRRRPWHLPAEVARALGVFHAAGRRNGSSIAHGDFAPWNLLQTGAAWVVIDWEDLRTDAPPFYDVFHYLVQSCALLGRPSKTDLVQGLTQPDAPMGTLFQSYASGAELDTGDLVQHFLDYVALSRSTLDPAVPDGRRGMRVRDALVHLAKGVR